MMLKNRWKLVAQSEWTNLRLTMVAERYATVDACVAAVLWMIQTLNIQ